MLALAFREPKVSRLKETLTEGEFLEWKTFYEIRPFGDEWEDQRIAWLNWHIPSFSESKKTFADFMPPISGRPPREVEIQSPETQAAILRMKFPRV